MADATSAHQREALTARIRDDAANLIEEIDRLQQRGLSGLVSDAPLETAYFVAFAHYITALMTVGHDRQLLGEVLGSSETFSKKAISQLLRSTRWPWWGRGLAIRMIGVRRKQYLDGLTNQESFVDTRELVSGLIQRLIPNATEKGIPGSLIGELCHLIEEYLINLQAFYETLFASNQR